MQKQFSELSVGDKFTVNGTEYVKMQEVRVSCCRSLNCYQTNNADQKTFFPGNTLVTVVTNG